MAGKLPMGQKELLRGKPSNRKTAEDIRSRVIEQYRLRYGDFVPAFAAEKLAEEEGAKTSVSALRRILMEEGLWQGKRRSREYRSRASRSRASGNRRSLTEARPPGLKAGGRAAA